MKKQTNKPHMTAMMRRELDSALSSLVTVLGSKFSHDEYGNKQDVYWEFFGGRPPVGDHVLASIQYDTKRKSMMFEVDGDHLSFKSKGCRTAGELMRTIRMWSRGKSSQIGVEINLLSKLRRLASQP